MAVTRQQHSLEGLGIGIVWLVVEVDDHFGAPASGGVGWRRLHVPEDLLPGQQDVNLHLPVCFQADHFGEGDTNEKTTNCL